MSPPIHFLLPLLGWTIVAQPITTAAEPVKVPWNRVRPLVKDSDVTVESTGEPKKVGGHVVDVRPDAIELQTPTGRTSLASDQIVRIRVHGRSNAPARILIGAAGGAALAALLAHPSKPWFTDGGLYQRNADGSTTKLDTAPHPNYGAAAAAGAGIGGFAGWLASRRNGSREIVIEIAPGGESK